MILGCPYVAGEKICVVNVYKLFNGKSVSAWGESDQDWHGRDR